MKKATNTVTPVLISLNISDTDLTHRRTTQYVDPETNIVYPGAQVEFSRKEHASSRGEDNEGEEESGDKDGEEQTQEEPVEQNLDEIFEETLDQVRFGDEDAENDDNQDDDNDDENDEEANIAEQQQQQQQSNESTLNPFPASSYTLIPKSVLSRLIRRPEDISKDVSKELANYNGFEQTLSNLRTTYFHQLHIIDIEASQPLATVISNVKECIKLSGFTESAYKNILPVRLAAPDQIEGISKNNLFKALASRDLAERGPKRGPSMFQEYCPVSWYTEGKLAIGDFQFPVGYKNHIYVFADEQAQKKFLANPDVYCSKPPSVNSMKLCVIGAPSTGKTTQCKILAAYYNLKYVSVDDVINSWDANPAAGTDPLYEKMVKRLKTGKTVSSEIMTEIVKNALGSHNNTNTNGWVLDGYPRTAEEASHLISANLAPTFAVTFTASSADIVIKERLEAQYPFADKMFENVKAEIVELNKVFESANVPHVSVSAAEEIPTLFHSILRLVDPFFPKAEVIFEALEPEQVAQDMFMGLTKDYCPVTLKLKNVLRKGASNFLARYNENTYYFASDAFRDKFVVEPHIFARQKPTPPPVRLCILGCPGTGKTSVSQSLKSMGFVGGAAHIDYKTFLTMSLPKVDEHSQKEVTSYLADPLTPLSKHTLVQVYRFLFEMKDGFILEDFPRHSQEAEILLNEGYAFDSVLVLKTDSEITAKRILRQQKRQEYEKQKQSGFAEVKRKRAKYGNDEEEDEEQQDPMDKIMQEYDERTNAIADIVTSFEGNGSTIIHEVEAGQTVRVVVAHVKQVLGPFITEQRPSLFAHPVPVTPKVADYLLNRGFKKYSAYRTFDPVDITCNGFVLSSSLGQRPIVLGNHIYFMKNQRNQREFLANPTKFISNEMRPIITPRVCVVGKPKSGKTTIARQLANQFNAVYITIPQIIQTILDSKDHLNIQSKLNNVLLKGQPLSNELVIEALAAFISRVDCQRQGWILDGYPTTNHEASLLESTACCNPNFILEMVVDNETMLKRTHADFEVNRDANPLIPTSQRLDLNEIVLDRAENYERELQHCRALFKSRYNNWIELNSVQSKWQLFTLSQEIVGSGLVRRQEYTDRTYRQQAASIHDIGINMDVVSQRIGKFGKYCPVRYVDDEELALGCSDSTFMAEYAGVYYKLGSQTALQTFLRSPERYAYGKDLPEKLPGLMSQTQFRSSFPQQLEIRGYCPVTFRQGNGQFESILKGSEEYLAEYDGKIFAMRNQDCLDKFMQTPWKFINITLPKKLPPETINLPVSSLPLIGYLEQTVATTLTEALVSVGKFKPKYPYCSLEKSAADYLGLYLKSTNERSKEFVRKSYGKKLDKFKEQCQLLQGLATSKISLEEATKSQNGGEYQKRLDQLIEMKPLSKANF